MNQKIEYPTEEQLQQCSELVLCKGELFFQTETGDTLLTWYPVGVETAYVCSLFFKIPTSIEGGIPIEKLKPNHLLPRHNICQTADCRWCSNCRKDLPRNGSKDDEICLAPGN